MTYIKRVTDEETDKQNAYGIALHSKNHFTNQSDTDAKATGFFVCVFASAAGL